MRKYIYYFIIILTSLSISTISHAGNDKIQKGHVILQQTVDVVRSTVSTNNLFKQFGIGFGMRYFVANKLAVGAGYEHTFVKGGKISTIFLANRFYLFGNTFLRIKPIFARSTFKDAVTKPTNDVRFEVGLGHNFMLSDSWSMEADVDYNLNKSKSHVVFRLGFTLMI